MSLKKWFAEKWVDFGRKKKTVLMLNVVGKQKMLQKVSTLNVFLCQRL